MSEAEKEFRDRLDRDFRYHPPHGDQTTRYGAIRFRAWNLACYLAASCPPSRERSIAITKLEEVVMWANAAIARNERPPAPGAPASDTGGPAGADNNAESTGQGGVA